ncbi:HIT family protein [Nitrosomonas oligotropha]|uniref:Diadenosine tetraphosphate (Ap4A) hydrolase n=1 Tax=Nitrosomonas oligotropha TaxID=42354 RepID=A0A1H8J0W7_9PROT|nr:HIT family protein [Nitrosomonas oligotropha]SDW10315.1 Diadenosine tetraphosphate (Ap4A) hydrolase [Nitrosomonas oligotropha]SEN73618.1 Diadenosine tetraphosphate (Ap4A) hydrolase [Nitrosomonas oligotropha]
MISATEPELNATMRKFGAPQTIIWSFQYWSVLLRPAQATLGALVLAAHEPAQAFSQLSPASFAELHSITGQIESALAKAFHYDKINYLMLMMVDPDVHFHVIPRYAQPKPFAGMEFIDAGWPAMPNLGQVNITDATINQHIMNHLQSCWS